MTDARETAAKALGEATEAMAAAVHAKSSAGRIDRGEAPELAYDIAQTLDMLVALLRTVDLDPTPMTAAEQTLEAVARHVYDAAGLAHAVAQRYRPHQRMWFDGDVQAQPDR
jgi:hypothetical protein